MEVNRDLGIVAANPDIIPANLKPVRAALEACRLLDVFEPERAALFRPSPYFRRDALNISRILVLGNLSDCNILENLTPREERRRFTLRGALRNGNTPEIIVSTNISNRHSIHDLETYDVSPNGVVWNDGEIDSSPYGGYRTFVARDGSGEGRLGNCIVIVLSPELKDELGEDYADAILFPLPDAVGQAPDTK